MNLKIGLPAVINSETLILMAGSLPSDISLAKNEYYGNPGNDFWRIMSVVLKIELTGLSYALRTKQLLDHKIGLWDIYASGVRKGSMDADLTEAEFIRFDLLKKKYPKLSHICLNGKSAGEAESLLSEIGFKTSVLLSSSGANRQKAVERIRQWQQVLS